VGRRSQKEASEGGGRLPRKCINDRAPGMEEVNMKGIQRGTDRSLEKKRVKGRDHP